MKSGIAHDIGQSLQNLQGHMMDSSYSQSAARSRATGPFSQSEVGGGALLPQNGCCAPQSTHKIIWQLLGIRKVPVHIAQDCGFGWECDGLASLIAIASLQLCAKDLTSPQEHEIHEKDYSYTGNQLAYSCWMWYSCWVNSSWWKRIFGLPGGREE